MYEIRREHIVSLLSADASHIAAPTDHRVEHTQTPPVSAQTADC